MLLSYLRCADSFFCSLPFPEATKIIPAFAAVTRGSPARLQEFHLQQLAILVGIIKQHIRNFVPAIFTMIKELWESTTLQLPIVSLIEALGKALDAELKQYLPSLFPLILKVFEGELTEKRISTQIKVFDAFLTFGVNIEEYLHLVIPIVVKSYERHDFPDRPESLTALRKRAIQTIDGLSRRINFSDHASRIILPLARVLEDGNKELCMAVMDTLCSLIIQLGSDFAIYVPTVTKVFVHLSLLNSSHRILKVFALESFPTFQLRDPYFQTSEW